jgi:glutaminyl-tRNA synthetase
MSEEKSLNFIEEIIETHLKEGKYDSILTRFPPEPNGYLHIGHAKSITLNFTLAQKYGGATNLRFDDTNPVTEDTEYVDSIKEDIKWLGYQWKNEFYASDYFDQLYEFAVKLIKKGKAYVDDSTSEEMAAMKGTPTTPGVESPYRNRSIEENLELFEAMKNGKYKDGEKVLRAKIDMTSSNMLLRDPVIYRIKHAHHHRTGTKWVIYPMYDFAHGQSDSIERITHSICTLEFAPHRPLYDWFIEQLEIFPSKQYEFARLNMTYTVMSKRKMLQLVNNKYVSGWDDPRMPTIAAFRRRGYTPEAIRMFCEKIGIAKRDNLIDYSLLEFCIREHLNETAPRTMAVLNPLKVVITNYPDGQNENLVAENMPHQKENVREVSFSRNIWIEKDDFMEVADKKWHRLSLGGMVRLKHAYIIKCDEVVKDANGEITELHCTYIPESKSGSDTSGISVKGVIHWVDCATAKDATVHLYDRLFTIEDTAQIEGDFEAYLNPNSLVTVQAKVEPYLLNETVGNKYQFLRNGYFCKDRTSTPEHPVFNRTVTLKDTWLKEKNKA